MTESGKNTAECCPPFDTSAWNNKLHVWTDKLFVKDSVKTFLYAPLNFGKVITRLMKTIEQSGASSPDWMGLSEHISKWKMDIYVAVDKEVAGTENHKFSGKYYSMVFEGNFNESGKWLKQFGKHLNSLNYSASRQFMWYTTCPKCAKKYGKNYVVILAQLEG